ncbi:MAG: DUF4147 domain-containing protein [Rhodobacteraceae bacterium]|nr:DUF4147 domain-containing protein [Paracoccaceae bacterium]
MSAQVAELRAEARRLFAAGIAAADPAEAVSRALAQAMPRPGPGGRLHLLAFGKAACTMADAALATLSAPLAAAMVITNHGNGRAVPGAQVLEAGHPEPDDRGEAAAKRVEALLRDAREGDVVLALISGGGSALLPAPVAGLSLADKVAVNRLLLASGLPIESVNLVRQGLSRLKGGGMLAAAAPARVEALILSDVVGNDPRAIASGPTAAPLGSRAEARALLMGTGLWPALPAPARAALMREPAPRPRPPAPVNRIVGSGRLSLEAMAAAAAPRARIVTDCLTGDVGEAATRIAREAGCAEPGPCVLLFGGETTVRVTGPGMGGRNQELALRIALTAAMPMRPWAFLSGGTDGRDGPTEAAGGLVDAGTAARIRAAGGDAPALLSANDSHRALSLAGDLLLTGPTGTNVADLQLLLLG